MNKWAAVALLWLVCFFNYADRQAIYSVFPLLKTEMGLTDVQLGIVAASFMWVYAADGRRSDELSRVDRRRVAPIAIAMASERYGMSAAISASSIVYLLVGSLLLFGTARFMKPRHA